jgi:SNF2 family DNA or RNA helicase
LVVPTNVLSRWEEEFEKWTGELVPSVQLYNLGNIGKEACVYTIKIWSRRGGILLVSKGRFVSLKKSGKYNEVSSLSSTSLSKHDRTTDSDDLMVCGHRHCKTQVLMLLS